MRMRPFLFVRHAGSFEGAAYVGAVSRREPLIFSRTLHSVQKPAAGRRSHVIAPSSIPCDLGLVANGPIIGPWKSNQTTPNTASSSPAHSS